MKRIDKAGRLVAQLRDLIGKSQSQFAAMVGVSKHTIISVENGRNKLSRNLAKRIQLATGANIGDENFEFQVDGFVSASEKAAQLSPEAVAFLRRRHDGTGKNDRAYTREDFEQWRKNFYPSNDRTARKRLEEMKLWLEVVFRAAAKPGVAGNRDRLPAVRQSLVEWLNETAENFKLEKEIDDILEAETHKVGEIGYSISSLTNPEQPKDIERVKEEFASYGYDFAKISKRFSKAKPGDWIVLETEYRALWDPLDSSEHIPCDTRTLLQNPKFRIVDGWEFLDRFGVSKESALKELADLKAKKD